MATNSQLEAVKDFWFFYLPTALPFKLIQENPTTVGESSQETSRAGERVLIQSKGEKIAQSCKLNHKMLDKSNNELKC